MCPTSKEDSGPVIPKTGSHGTNPEEIDAKSGYFSLFRFSKTVIAFFDENLGLVNNVCLSHF